MDRLGDRVETIERKSLGMVNRAILEEIQTLEKTITLILERLALTKTLDLHSKKTMLKLQLPVNQQNILKLT